MWRLALFPVAFLMLLSFADIYFMANSQTTPYHSPIPPTGILTFTFILGGVLVGALREQSEQIAKLQAQLTKYQSKNQTDPQLQ